MIAETEITVQIFNPCLMRLIGRKSEEIRGNVWCGQYRVLPNILLVLAFLQVLVRLHLNSVSITPNGGSHSDN
jgi:hypothetical protein